MLKVLTSLLGGLDTQPITGHSYSRQDPKLFSVMLLGNTQKILSQIQTTGNKVSNFTL